MDHALARLLIAAIAIGVAGAAVAQVPDFPHVPPTEAAYAEGTLRALGGFRMELIAAEPLVADPVDLAYDPDGRAYVVEFRGYPRPELPDDPPPKPIGRVRLLEDTDGDGTFDVSHVFAGGLLWPTSVVFWKAGVFVAAPPDIWYFEDTDGDHRADVRRKVFTGFGQTNVQAVMNNLRWGLDHRIYGAAGSNGGDVVSIDRPDAKPVSLRRRDFRFDPTTGVLAAISGGQRFGNAFDDWGNRFLCNIRNPVQHVLLPSRYLDRNRWLTSPPAVHDVADAGDRIAVYRISPPEAWRVFRAQRWAKERVNYPQSELVGAGYFTSSSGVTIYRGAAYPPEYRGNAFVADVAANIVHRQVLKPDGVSFRSQRGDEGAEFVASTDPWFRPVNFVNAPDGTLTVLDMYRETIEHPWSIPDDIRAKLDLSSGSDRGRLYRLAPPGFEPPEPPRLAAATTPDLVRVLENPSAWWRETAHRLLYERQDPSAIEPLRALLRDSDVPQARLHALWSLEGLGALTEEDLLVGFADSQPQVREHAVKLAEPRLKESPALTAAVLTAAGDENARVRMQSAFTLGVADADTAIKGLAHIARSDAGDLWTRTAVLSSAAELALPLLRELVRESQFQDRVGGMESLEQFALFAAARNDDGAEAVLNLVGTLPADIDDVQYALVAGVADGLLRRGRRIADLPSAERATKSLLDRAEATAADRTLPPSHRLPAVDLLRHGDFARARRVLPGLLGPRETREIQLDAVRVLGSFSDTAAAELLLKEMRGLAPAVQSEVIETLLRRPPWITLLLDAMETGAVRPSLIPVVRRNLLLSNRDESIRQRAERLFGADVSGPRNDVIDRYQPALASGGNAAEGQSVFRRECAACHRMAGEGHDVGPALTTVQHRSADEILIHILDPNREVSPDWVDYAVVLKDGRVLTGLLASESEAGLTLRRGQDIEEFVPRSAIDEISSTGRSLMPEGLERNIKPQEMADLIAFLHSRGATSP